MYQGLARSFLGTRVVKVAVLAIVLASVLSIIGPVRPAEAHLWPYCGHHNTSSNGWFVQYLGYKNANGIHYHYYKHFSGGAPLHTYYKKC